MDHRRTILDICDKVGIGYGTYQAIITEELGMHRTIAEFVPKLLTYYQKQERIDICKLERRSDYRR